MKEIECQLVVGRRKQMRLAQVHMVMIQSAGNAGGQSSEVPCRNTQQDGVPVTDQIDLWRRFCVCNKSQQLRGEVIRVPDVLARDIVGSEILQDLAFTVAIACGAECSGGVGRDFRQEMRERFGVELSRVEPPDGTIFV